MVPMWRQIAIVAVPVWPTSWPTNSAAAGSSPTFVAGLTFGRLVLASYPDIADFAEDLAEVLTMVAFMIFGGLLLQPRFGDFTWEMLLYAVLSLTLVRMLPVAISMIGTHLRPPSLLYMGWFGPRGLASLIFAAIVIEEADIPATDLMVTIVILTVALSILLHGITAYPGANAYADWYEHQEDRPRRDAREQRRREHPAAAPHHQSLTPAKGRAGVTEATCLRCSRDAGYCAGAHGQELPKGDWDHACQHVD